MYIGLYVFFKLIYYTDTRHKVYKDKLQNCFCNQFHCIGTCNRVETNSMTNNRGGNKRSEKWIKKSLIGLYMKQLSFHWTDFQEICYLIIFRKSVGKILVSLQYDKHNGGICTTLANDSISDSKQKSSY